MIAATLEASFPTEAQATVDTPERHKLAERLSLRAYQAYRDLVYATPDFITYFREATPINEIPNLNIGSRPAARKKHQFDCRSARDSVGVQLVAMSSDAAGLVWLWHCHR